MPAIDEAEIKRFEQSVANLVAYVERSIAIDAPEVITEVRRLCRAVQGSRLGNSNVRENLGRIQDDVAVLCSARKWQRSGREWHQANLNNAVAGLEMAAERCASLARGEPDGFPA